MADTFAGQPARSDRHHRLSDIIAATTRIGGARLEKRHDTGLLVRGQNEPATADDHHSENRQHNHMRPANTCHEYHTRPDAKEHKSAPEIRLEEHCYEEYPGQYKRGHETDEVTEFGTLLGNEASEEDDKDELGNLDRLEIEQTEREPTATTTNRRSDGQHQNKDSERTEI